jgi:hypothetical protein
MSKHTKAPTDAPQSDAWAWGAQQIGKEIGRTASQVHYMHENGLLGDATFKLGHKTLVGDRRKLRNLQAYATET